MFTNITIQTYLPFHYLVWKTFPRNRTSRSKSFWSVLLKNYLERCSTICWQQEVVRGLWRLENGEGYTWNLQSDCSYIFESNLGKLFNLNASVSRDDTSSYTMKLFCRPSDGIYIAGHGKQLTKWHLLYYCCYFPSCSVVIPESAVTTGL